MDKKKISLAILGIVLISTAISIYYTQINSPNKNLDYGDVTVDEARTLIESKPNLIILDVRTQGEYDDGHIKGAILISVVELEDRLDELSKNKEILVYCRTGTRSSNAVNMLETNGFTMIYHMNEGINAWIQAGYDIAL